jgi:uncharacterized membrane protein
MSTAFLIDLSLVLTIELQRQAIENVIVSKSAFVWFHVTVSTLVLVLYIVLAITGSKMSKIAQGPVLEASRFYKIHKIVSVLFIILRLTNFFTSLSMPINIQLSI